MSPVEALDLNAAVEMLLKKGADVNVQNSIRNTALTEASDKEHIDIVKILLSKSSPVDVANKYGTKGMHKVIQGYINKIYLKNTKLYIYFSILVPLLLS